MTELIDALTIIFLTASIALFAVHRLSHPTIPAYILAGIVAGLFLETEALLSLAQLGIAFLIFLFGIKMEQERLATIARESVLVTVAQVLGIGVITYVIGYMVGLDTLNALYISIAATLSSSLVGIGILRDTASADLVHHRIAESINLIQDLIGVFAILVVTTETFTLPAILTNTMYGIGFIAAAITIRETIAHRIFAAVEQSRELVMLIGLTCLAGFVVAAEYAGMSIMVGAFAAGMAIARYPLKMEVLESMEPLKDFFAAVFFVVLGALITAPGTMTVVAAASLIAVTVLIKPAIVTLLVVESGYDSRTAFLSSMGLDHVSEFALIIAIQAYIAGTIQPVVFQAIILAAVITMLLSSYTSRYAEPIYSVLERHNLIHTNYDKLQQHTHIRDELDDHIVLAGYGVQGKLIAEDLRREDETFVVIDNDPEAVITAGNAEENVVFGNVRDSRTWKQSQAADAKLIISTIPHTAVSHAILDRETDADVILRAADFDTAEDLLDAGATYVAVPDLMAADQLRAVIRGALTSEEYREELRKRNLLELRSYFYSDEQ